MKVQLQGVSKRFDNKPALDNLSFTVPSGAICGLIGPNGAGKTTTLGILGGLLRFDAGTVSVGGHRLSSTDSRLHGSLSLMPQDALPSDVQSIRAVMQHYARLQGVSPLDVERQAERRLDEVALLPRASARFSELSHGMRRRFGIAQALLGSPQVLLLDEPTSGLDPEHVVQIRDLIKAHRGRATVLVSSHILSELEALCDYVVFMSDGRCVREGSLKEVTQGACRVRYALQGEPELGPLRLALPDVQFVFTDGHLVAAASTGTSAAELNAEVLPLLLAQRLGILAVSSGESLEDSYLRSREGRSR